VSTTAANKNMKSKTNLCVVDSIPLSRMSLKMNGIIAKIKKNKP